MSFKPESALETPLDENLIISKGWEEFQEQFTKLYRDIATKVNNKERAFYPLEFEIINDQRMFNANDTSEYRSVFRKVFSIGTIVAGATDNTAHGLTDITDLTRLFGAVLTTVPDRRPLPRVSTANINQQISLDIVGANIVIINGAGGPDITRGIVVLEFTKQ